MEEKDKDTQDFFFLKLVDEEEISYAITVMSKVEHIIIMVNNDHILKNIDKPAYTDAYYLGIVE